MDLKISDQNKILNVINTLKEKYRGTEGVSKFIALERLCRKRLCRRSIMCPEPFFSGGFELRKFLYFWRPVVSHEYFAFYSGFYVTLIMLFSRDLRRNRFRAIKVISSKTHDWPPTQPLPDWVATSLCTSNLNFESKM